MVGIVGGCPLTLQIYSGETKFSLWLLPGPGGQGDSKCCAAVDFAREVNRAVVELHHAKRHGEANAGASALGGIEDGTFPIDLKPHSILTHIDIYTYLVVIYRSG
jgi:hypothetical protein